MPYITEKTLAHAIKMVELYDDIKTQCCGNNDIIMRMENNEEIQRYYNIVAKHSKASKRHAFNAVMCENCDCLVVKMEEHLKTYKCMKVFETKLFAVSDKKPVNNEMVRSVNAINKCMGAIKNKNRDAFVKNIEKLTPQRKAKIIARTEKVLKKKMSGIALEKRTPNEIARDYKIARENKNRRVERTRVVREEAEEVNRMVQDIGQADVERYCSLWAGRTEGEIDDEDIFTLQEWGRMGQAEKDYHYRCWVGETESEAEEEEEIVSIKPIEEIVVKQKKKLRLIIK